ncbi:hypothetical protein [Desulfolucanica intricata]|uniref:hypothetical protein n=1 Tax=Desulfolucanica intricata TaxID=1285191 RepID=UPI0008350455|nr:hypothetical protein [Desulfolucanica intricata]
MTKMKKGLGVLLVAIVTLTLLAGCGKPPFAFEALEVKNKDIPEYEVGSEVDLEQNGLKMVWTTVEQKESTEEQAKKILADYIEKNKDMDYIEAMVKTKDESVYTAKYYKVEAAAKNSSDKKKIESYPAVIFDKQEKK